MAEPEKSSDEILQELFGMCAVKNMIKAEPSSPRGKDDGSDDNSSDSSKLNSHHKKNKHKKKRKKHKKGKKRKRSSSVSDSESEDESKAKRSKSRLKHDSNDVEVKIKIEKDALKSSKKNAHGESEDRKNSNLMDLITGKRLTIDDVFTTLGILTEDKKPTIKVCLRIRTTSIIYNFCNANCSYSSKVKQEKLDPDYGDIVKTEEPESGNDADVKPRLINTNADSDSNKNDTSSDAKRDQVAEAFESVENNGGWFSIMRVAVLFFLLLTI